MGRIDTKGIVGKCRPLPIGVKLASESLGVNFGRGRGV